MKIFIAGATGTLARPVVRLLLSHGHDLVGLTRSSERARALTALGVRGVVGNALDGSMMNALVASARPDQVLHLLTALPPGGPLRKSHILPTNELRTKGTANLIQAAIGAGARRLVAESFVGVYGAMASDHPITEDDPLPPVGSGVFAQAIGALRSLEAQLQEVRATGQLMTVSLRIGFFYGSDVPSTKDAVERARAGRLFVPRNFAGIGPFVHVDDAATAIVAAVEHPNPSAVYNVVDDEPVSLVAFLAKLTTAIGAAPPRRIPGWFVKLAAPLVAEFGTAKLRLSNDRIKRELGWTLRYPTIDAGLAEVKRMALDVTR